MTSKLTKFSRTPSKSSLIPPSKSVQKTQAVKADESTILDAISAPDTEFNYYRFVSNYLQQQQKINLTNFSFRTLLKILVPTLKNVNHKENIALPWVYKLTQPEPKTTQRQNRNRYMMMLCLMCMRDELEG
jgi:hypothetical protein